MNQDTCKSDKTCHLIELGKIGRPHGVSGDMRLFLHNPSSDLIFQLDSVFLCAPDGDAVSKYTIHLVKQGARFHILSLKNIRNRDGAQRLNGMLLMVPRDAFPALDDGEYYVADLMGIEVVCDGKAVGIISDSRAQGGIEVVTVTNDEREIQIPMVDDYVIRKDFSARIIEVKNIDDLPVHEFARKVR